MKEDKMDKIDKKGQGKSLRGFRICNGDRGFHITFDNMVTVSVQFGRGMYCQNRDAVLNIGMPQDRDCEDAEIAIWKEDGEWITEEFKDTRCGDVLGWQTPVEVLEALNWASNWKPEEVK